jgi:tRNA A37 threonylcarbamoyladenosine biosynthesis protein TsaE
VTLLERKTVLDALAEIAAQARSGEGRLLLLEGEAGVGKSTAGVRGGAPHHGQRDDIHSPAPSSAGDGLQNLSLC